MSAVWSLKLREARPIWLGYLQDLSTDMLPLFRDLARDPDSYRTIIVVDEMGTAPPRQYRMRPRRVLLASASGTVLLAGLMTALIVVSPLRTLIFGPDPETLRETARMTAVKAAALADSLEIQREYLAVIRATLTGMDDTVDVGFVPPDGETADMNGAGWLELPSASRTEHWGDHDGAALAPQVFHVSRQFMGGPEAAEGFLAHLQFPALPPVGGFFARGYDTARGHFGIDIAVDEDTPVRAIGDGYVVFADWTNDGGYVLAVQHAGGFLSVYKHNRRLLKTIGDRVRSRETVAMSGNTGEVTTGPHVHFELWRNGLAQDPRQYLVGL